MSEHRVSPPISPLLRDIPDELRFTVHTRKDDGSLQAWVTEELYEAMLDEFRQRWERDLEFARSVCREHGIDIDRLADEARAGS